MGRALLIVLDSVGIGGAPDAQAYGDLGSDTLGHIAQACALGRGNREGLRAGPLRLPHLAQLGLGLACSQATGAVPPGLDPQGEATALWGSAIETSCGKDTPSGHWELMGCPVDFDWGYFPQTVPTFPPDLIAALCDEGGLPGILGNRHASGTAIIAELGAEHMRSGRPIVYTSTDSVLQIAAHEETFGLQRLLDLCVIARRLCDPLRIGRVIARPFLGTPETGFSRTGNRRDYAVPPPRATLFDSLAGAGREVVSVGKIADIFAHRATGREVKAHGNMAVVDACLAALDSLADGGFVFGNCVDFDSDFGHRRDVPGYAAALEAFDARVPDLLAALRPGDLLVLTADHGNDPTWPGTDHTREQIPVLALGPGLSFGAIGTRSSLADVGASIAAHLGIDWRGPGTSFLAQGLR